MPTNINYNNMPDEYTGMGGRLRRFTSPLVSYDDAKNFLSPTFNRLGGNVEQGIDPFTGMVRDDRDVLANTSPETETIPITPPEISSRLTPQARTQNLVETKPLVIPESRFVPNRGGFIQVAGEPGSRMELRYTPTGQPFVSRGGTPGIAESGRAFEELPQQNVFPATPATSTMAPSPLDAAIVATEKQMADYAKYSPENIAAQARKEGRPKSDIPVLIERYGKQRGDYKDMVDSYQKLLEMKSGKKSEKPTEGLKTIETADSIMQWNPKTNLYDIKVGEAKETAGMRQAAAKETIAAEKEALKEFQTMQTSKFISSKVDEALTQISGWKTGLTGATLAKIPGTDAYNFNKTIDTIKANIGFEQLNAMRQSSPTGGALGQVAVRELDFLQAALGSLEIGQDKTQLKKNLEGVKKHYDNWVKNQAKYLKEQGGVAQPDKTATGRTVTKTGIHQGKRVIQYSDGTIEYAQ